MMYVGIPGSRGYPRLDLVENFVLVLARKYPDSVVVTGGALGVDTTAENAAVECGLETHVYEPHEKGITVRRWYPDKGWDEHPIMGFQSWVKNAFFRNEFIASSDRVAAFWDLKSTGTADTISKARAKQRELFVYGPDGALLTERQLADLLKGVFG